MNQILTYVKYLSLLFAVVVLAGCIAPITDTSEDAELTPVSIAVGARNTTVFLNFDVAQALGYFADEGLDVDLRYFDGGSDAARALRQGEVDFSGNAIDHVLEAQMAGQSLRMLMAFLDQPCITLVVRSDLADSIQTPEDLRGRKVGVTRFGSATHTLTTYLLAEAGVPASDYEAIEVGASGMPDALTSDAVDAAMGVAPYTTRLIQAGEAQILVDLCQPDEAEAAIGGGIPFTGLLTRADVIENQPDVAQRVVNALVAAQTFITTHDAEEIVAALPSEVVGEDVASFVSALDATLPAFNRSGSRIDPADLETLRQIHVAFGTLAEDAPVDLNALYDNEFVDAVMSE